MRKHLLGIFICICFVAAAAWVWGVQFTTRENCDNVNSAGIIIPLDSTYGVWMPVNSGDTIGHFYMHHHANGDATFTIYGDTIMLRRKKNDYEK